MTPPNNLSARLNSMSKVVILAIAFGLLTVLIIDFFGVGNAIDHPCYVHFSETTFERSGYACNSYGFPFSQNERDVWGKGEKYLPSGLIGNILVWTLFYFVILFLLHRKRLLVTSARIDKVKQIQLVSLKPYPVLLMLFLSLIFPYGSYELSNCSGLFCGITILIVGAVAGFVFGILPLKKSFVVKNILLFATIAFIFDIVANLIIFNDIANVIYTLPLIFASFLVGRLVYFIINWLFPTLYRFIFVSIPIIYLVTLFVLAVIVDELMFGGGADALVLSKIFIPIIAVGLMAYRHNRELRLRFIN